MATNQSLAKEIIKTYVFMDTETTGLQSPGNNPRITEICLLAYSREELLTHTKHPRVCNKLTLCLDPCRPIQPKSTEITGLHNDALEGMPTFKTQASLVATFLKNLPQPVCMVAHNGNRFDFPLLKAEFNKCSLPEAIDSILCADSLWAFRNLHGLPSVPQQHRSNIPSKSNLEDKGDNSSSKTEMGPSSESGKDKLCSNVSDICDKHFHISKIDASKEPVNKVDCNSSVAVKLSSEHEDLKPSSQEEQEMRVQDEVTPVKIQDTVGPVNPFKRGSNPISQPDSVAKKRLFTTDQEDSPSSSPLSTIKHKSCAILEVKTEKCPSQFTTQPPSFSLQTLYRHYFGQEPDVSHAAENDCVTLMKIVKVVNCKKFFTWCNENACSFQSIPPMY